MFERYDEKYFVVYIKNLGNLERVSMYLCNTLHLPYFINVEKLEEKWQYCVVIKCPKEFDEILQIGLKKCFL